MASIVLVLNEKLEHNDDRMGGEKQEGDGSFTCYLPRQKLMPKIDVSKKNTV